MLCVQLTNYSITAYLRPLHRMCRIGKRTNTSRVWLCDTDTVYRCWHRNSHLRATHQIVHNVSQSRAKQDNENCGVISILGIDASNRLFDFMLYAGLCQYNQLEVIFHFFICIHKSNLQTLTKKILYKPKMDFFGEIFCHGYVSAALFSWLLSIVFERL